MHIQQAFKLRQLFVVKHNVDILISYRDKNFTGITLIYVPRFPFFTIYLHYVFHKILVLWIGEVEIDIFKLNMY